MSWAAGTALEISARPPEEMRIIQHRYSQKAFVRIISGRVKSLPATVSRSWAFARSCLEYSSGGLCRTTAPITRITKNTTANTWKVVRQPIAASSVLTGGPSTALPKPMPMSMQPEAIAWRSGNHFSAVARLQLPATRSWRPGPRRSRRTRRRKRKSTEAPG